MAKAPDTLEIPDRSRAVTASIVGSFLVRLGGAATGVMLGFLLARLHRSGAAQSSEMAIGLLTAAFYVSELLGAPLAGFLVDRRGIRPLLLAGPILGIVAEIFFASPSRLFQLTIARLLQGMTTACTIPAALAFLSNATEDETGERGRTMSFFEVGSIGGLAVGYVAGGLLWDFFHRAGFWLLILPYSLAVALFVFIRTGEGRAPPPRGISLAAIRRATDLMPSWLCLNAAAGLWFGQAAYQLSGANPRPGQLLTEGLPSTTIGIIFGGYTLLFALGTIGWGSLLSRVRLGLPLRIGALGLLLVAGALFGLNHAGDFAGPVFVASLGLAVVALAAQTAYTPAALTLLAQRSDSVRQGRGAVMGVYAMLLAGGQLIGAILGSGAARALGVDGLVLVTACLGLLGLATLPRPEETGIIGPAITPTVPGGSLVDARPSEPEIMRERG